MYEDVREEGEVRSKGGKGRKLRREGIKEKREMEIQGRMEEREKQGKDS